MKSIIAKVLLACLILAITIGSVTLVAQYDISMNSAKAAQTPAENCEQYYLSSIKEAEQISPRLYTESTNSGTLRSIMYSLLYQNCIAYQKRQIPNR